MPTMALRVAARWAVLLSEALACVTKGLQPRSACPEIEDRIQAKVGQMATARTAIADYTKKIALAELNGQPASEDRVTVATLRTRYENLRNMPNEPDLLVYVQNGLTIPQHYENLNDQGKHAMFMSHGVRIRVQQIGNNLVTDIDWATIGADDLPTISEDELAALLASA